MICKNCGKEMKNGDVFCRECGAKTESNNTVQSSKINLNNVMDVMKTSANKINLNGVVSFVKASKARSILIAVFAVLIIIVIACALGGSRNVIESDNYNGMSFNYDLSEWCDSFNKAIKEVDSEFDTEIDLNINTSSFKLDNTDCDPTDANVVRYYYENSKSNVDFAISLYVDTDTEKVCKCDITNTPVNGDDLTLFEHFCLIPAVMATSNIDYDTACSTMKDVFSSDNCLLYNDNIYYQFGSTSTYDITSIQAVSQEVYDEKY
ncbi:MAG: zinc ribbon domain-containing protein [Clostridium sp.]|nr:zinc ribbon domain-containing protein [Clostridium sp.]